MKLLQLGRMSLWEHQLSLWVATVLFSLIAGVWWGLHLGHQSDSRAAIFVEGPKKSSSKDSAQSAELVPGPIVSNRGNGFFELLRRSTVPEGELSLSGWAFDIKGESPVTRVWVVINNLAPIPVLSFRGGIERPDVVQSFQGNKAYTHSGWEASFSTKGLRRGSYPFMVYAECEDGTLFPLAVGGESSPTIVIPE